MRQLYCIFLVSALVSISPLSFAGVDFTLSSPADGLVTIGYAADEDAGIFGLALNVSLSNATAVYTDIVSIHPAFNTFVDYAFDNGAGYEIGDGHPFADPDNAGTLEDPASSFTLSMGHLDVTGGQSPAPAIVENLITFRIQGSGDSYVTISENTLRGGVVGDNIGTVTMPQPLLVTIPEPATLTLLALGTLIVRKRTRIN